MKLLDREEKGGRMLAHNKRSEQPRHHVFFDVESFVKKRKDGTSTHTFRLGWACYWRRDTGKEEWQYLDTPEKLLDFIESKVRSKDRIYVWAHNAFYDFAITKLHTLLATKGWKKHTHYFAGGKGSWFIIVKRGSASLVFLDVMNFYQQSLKKLGELIGEHKADVDPLTASEEELIPYCRQDVLVIRKAVERFLTFIACNDLGNVGKTLASTSMNVYRHKFMRYPIHIHKHVPSWLLEHASYYGGRVELFRVGKTQGPLYYLDINSQYPSVMASTELPCQLLSYEEGNGSADVLAPLLNKYFCVADVTLETDVARYPVRIDATQCQDGSVVDNDPLRVLTEKGLRVAYPVGRFRTALSHASLKSAWKAGHIVTVHRLAVYQKALLFHDFVKEFWNRRREAQLSGNSVDAYLYKILLNSFYGKWGQKQANILATYPCDPTLWEVEETLVNGERVTIERILGVERWITKSEKASYNSFPAIAAGVTDGGRELLWQVWQEAGMENCVYSDTDSVIVNQEGFERLQHRIGNELGQLKLEHTLDYLVVHGPKDYEHNLGSKHKGVSGKAVFNEEKGVWTQEQWLRPHGSLREKSLNEYVTRTVEKRLLRTITTKKALAGGLLAPFSFGKKEE